MDLVRNCICEVIDMTFNYGKGNLLSFYNELKMNEPFSGTLFRNKDLNIYQYVHVLLGYCFSIPLPNYCRQSSTLYFK